MDPKIKCFECGSYIHETERCWNWKERRMCNTDNKYKEYCDCNHCKLRKRCSCCNSWCEYCYCDREGKRCSICNEYLKIYNKYNPKCFWDHTKSPCQFCKLPLRPYNNYCSNNHRTYYSLCKECNMPEIYEGSHHHDGTKCKICNSLLNRGKCIYKCVDGGKLCIYCRCETVVNDRCWYCNKEQSGFLTKGAIK